MVTICVVDDDEMAADWLTAALRASWPSDGEEFVVAAPVAVVQDVPLEATLVVCDLHLQRVVTSTPAVHLSGPSAIGYLVDERGCQVVACSRIVHRSTVIAAMACGARAFISKDRPQRMELWKAAVEAVASGQHFVSAVLAAYLREDARLRPLDNPRDDLTEEARTYLRDVITAADEPELLPYRWKGTALVAIHEQLWRVLRRRHRSYEPPVLTERLLRAAPYLMIAKKQAQVAEIIGERPGTLRSDLDNFRDKWIERYSGTPLADMSRERAVIQCYHRYLEENGLEFPTELPR